MTPSAEDVEAVRPTRADVVKVSLLGLAQAGALVGMLLLLRRAIDEMAQGRPIGRNFFLLLSGLAALGLANAWLRGLEFSVSEKIGYERVRLLRGRLHERLRGQAPRDFQRRSRGGLLLRFTGDLTSLRTWISRGFARGISSSIVIVAAFGLMAYLSPPMALVSALVLAVGVLVSTRVGLRLRRRVRSVRRRRALLASTVAEQITRLPVVQVFGRFGGEHSRLCRQNDTMTESLAAVATTRGVLRGISSASAWLSTVAALAVGAHEISVGRTTIGSVVAAITAIRMLSGPIRNMGLAQEYWRTAQVSRSKILALLGQPGRLLDTPDLVPLRIRRGRIEFREVRVDGALNEVTAIAEPGQVVAITGPNGAGKSTLLWLVARLTEPDAGAVLIDDQPLADCSRSSSHRQIGMMGPDLPLMQGTIERNLTYRCPDASPEEVARVSALCELDSLVARLPQGAKTWLTEDGANLSTGERRKLTLARALMGNPPILLLDEPTAFLDQATVQTVHNAVARHHGTTILVTHDPDELAIADQVWVMEGGAVVRAMSGAAYADWQWRQTAGLAGSGAR